VKHLTRNVFRSASFYPITTLWVSSCLVGALVEQDIIRVGVGVVLVSLVAILALLVAAWREMMNLTGKASRNDLLLERVEYLIDLLEQRKGDDE
jgi:hypothetical protein